MQARDGNRVRVCGRAGGEWPQDSCFASLQEASRFFESGNLGYSVRTDSDDLDGLILETLRWEVEPLQVLAAFVSAFVDEARFPPGSVQFDHALLMRNIAHQWHTAPSMNGA